jgi:hypothetical protein
MIDNQETKHSPTYVITVPIVAMLLRPSSAVIKCHGSIKRCQSSSRNRLFRIQSITREQSVVETNLKVEQKKFFEIKFSLCPTPYQTCIKSKINYQI